MKSTLKFTVRLDLDEKYVFEVIDMHQDLEKFIEEMLNNYFVYRQNENASKNFTVWYSFKNNKATNLTQQSGQMKEIK